MLVQSPLIYLLYFKITYDSYNTDYRDGSAFMQCKTIEQYQIGDLNFPTCTPDYVPGLPGGKK